MLLLLFGKRVSSNARVCCFTQVTRHASLSPAVPACYLKSRTRTALWLVYCQKKPTMVRRVYVTPALPDLCVNKGL